LADDVPAIVRGLKKMIAWEQLGLELVGEATNGEQLLEEIERKRPNIVISDIAMPGMSGIEVLKELTMRKLNVKLIFISAYREFAYAQDALKYGAIDYLIKPVNRDRLEKLLEQTVAAIKAELRGKQQEKRLNELECREKRQQITEAMSRIAEENMTHELPYLKRELEALEQDNLYTVVAMEPASAAHHSGSWQEGEKRLLYFAVQNMIVELSANKVQAWPVTGAGYFYMVMRHRPDCDLVSLLREWHAETARALKLAITFAPGIAVPLEQLSDSYRRAVALLPYRFYAGVNGVLTERELSGGEPPSEAERQQTEAELCKAVLKGETEHVRLLLHSCMAGIAALSWGNRDYTITLLNGLMKRLHAEIRQAGIAISFQELQYVDKLSSAETYSDAVDYAEHILDEMMDEIHAKGASRELILCNRIKSYMLENYADDITLESLSARFYMNPYYLSVFFKRHMGKNFKTYMTEFRLKKAIQLMASSDAMLYEIAEQVGFHNSRQFSELFKKYYGVLPNDYRKSFEQGGRREDGHEVH
jgi:two-component system response regulator YesN